MQVQGHWSRIFEQGGRAELERKLPAALTSARWFADKAREIRSATVREAIPFAHGTTLSYLTLVEVEFMNGGSKTYVLPWSFSAGRLPGAERGKRPSLVMAMDVEGDTAAESGLLYDALWDEGFVLALLDLIQSNGQIPAEEGRIAGSRPEGTERIGGSASSGGPVSCSVMDGEQSNTSVVVGDRSILKLYRQLGEGINPELEIGRVLTKMRFPHTPALTGAIEYCRPTQEPVTVATVQRFVENQGDAWRFSLGAAQEFFSRVAARGLPRCPPQCAGPSPLEWFEEECPGLVRELIGSYLASVERLGQRTADLHVALAQASANVNFAPESSTKEYWTMRYESQVRLTTRTLGLLRARAHLLSADAQQEAVAVLRLEAVMLARFQDVLERDLVAWRIRCHGDYHLGQILCTGRDFIMIDFEGEPARSLTERRTKHPTMVDVAGMLRSLQYVPYACLGRKQSEPDVSTAGSTEDGEAWAECWSGWTGVVFLKAYISGVSREELWPSDREGANMLMVAHLLEKAVYELAYELNNRPGWVRIPLKGILKTLELARR
jgi:trehalose synthase-fused probable maltokinase